MEDEYWARFTVTGSVTDYLSYREAVKSHERQEQTVQGEAYDRKYYSDGNDSVSRTDW